MSKVKNKKKQYPSIKKGSLTVNVAIDTLSNSNNWVGADVFIWPPKGNCYDEDFS